MKLKALVLSLLAASSTLNTDAQTVTLVAGNLGGIGYAGDGGPATAAACKMSHPSLISHDAAGNIYFIDHNNQSVRKITPAGIISTVAGNGTEATAVAPAGVPATSVGLHPILKGLAVDAAGNIYLAESNYIRKVTTAGILTNYAGSGVGGNGGDGGPATAAELDFGPIAIDPAGNVVMAGYNTPTVRKINNTTGIITTIAGSTTATSYTEGAPATTVGLSFIRDIEYDAAGNLYILMAWSNGAGCVRKVNAAGIITTVAGPVDYTATGFSGDGGPATAARFNEPTGLAIDNWGSLYIADGENRRIRRMTPSGIISTYVGTGIGGFNGNGLAATATNIRVSAGLDVNSGYLYFPEAYNTLIRRTDVVAAPAGLGAISGETGGISIYPMPCRETFTLSGDAYGGQATVSFTDVTGKQVAAEEISATGNSRQYSTKGMAPGVYVVRVLSADKTYTLRLIKE